jgi:hypothetical protein
LNIQPGRVPVLVAFGVLWVAQACFMAGWGWAGSIFTLAGWAVLRRGGGKNAPEPVVSSGWLAVIGAALFALSLAFRLYHLDSHPPFWWDEGVQAYDVRSFLAGKPLEPLEEIRYHRSPLWMGVLASFSILFGHSVTALRMAGVLAGSVVPVLALFLGARLFGARAGILSGAFLAWHPWLLHQSRMSHGSILTPVMAALILLVATSPGISFRWRGILAGLVAGVNIYGYAASYQLPFLGALALLLVPGRGASWRERGVAILLVLGISAAFAFPADMVMPGYWGKTMDVSAGGKPALAWQNFLGSIRMFHLEGDFDMRHWYPPGAPVLGPLLGPVFSLGAGLVLAGRNGWAGWLALGWLLLGMLPGLATVGGDRNLFRMVGAAPATAILCAIGGAELWGSLGRRRGILAVLVVWLVSGCFDLRSYFSGYAKDQATSSVFRSYAGEAGKELAMAAAVARITVCPPLTLARHPLEKLALFDAISAGRVSFAGGPCGMRGEKKVFRDSFGQPQAVIFRAGSRIEYHTLMDICMEGDRLQGGKQPAGAGAYYRGWQAVFPDSFVLMERVGFADLKAGKSEQAVMVFREAVARGSNLGSTWDGLASALYRTGKYGEAEKALERALQLEPGNAEFRRDIETVRKAAAKRKQGGK